MPRFDGILLFVVIVFSPRSCARAPKFRAVVAVVLLECF